MCRTNARRLVPLVLLGACVQYKSITPPGGGAPSPKALPDVVTVTTRDSVHHRLEGAEFRHDTLVGYPTRGNRSHLVRIPVSEVAHMEGRVSTLESNVSGGLMVMAVSLALLGPLLFILYNPST